MILAVMLLAMGETLMAQSIERRGCLVNWAPPSSARGGQTRSGMTDIPYSYWKWDANRTYRQLVVLVSFADCDFSLEDPRGTYDSIFNTPDYTQLDGAGCVADYFRDQSDGLFNLQFDVYGPYKTSCPVKTGLSERNEGHRAFIEATEMLMAEHPDMDFSPYDWDGDNIVEPVVYVYAGYCGNQPSIKNDGYIWPTTGNYSTIRTPSGHQIFMYTASGELWANNTSHGIGTICHEFSHCLGLPDVYPTSSKVSDLSIVDEWDLMDGGTTTNYGWCPPNYSPLEKMILGWLTPTELTADTTVTGLKPVAEGGEAFLIRQSDDEFYLLENRQWNGWDYGLPGYGLVVYHVIYNKVYWQINNVNNVQDKPDYSLKAADGRTFTDWYNLIIGSGASSQYADPERRLHSRILSGASYPWQDEEMLVNQMTLFDEKSLSDVTQHEDGTVSFNFHTSGSGIFHLKAESRATGVYTLSGQKLRDVGRTFTPLRRGVYIINGKKKIVR
jgi:M6 family metalloprotease-like protein